MLFESGHVGSSKDILSIWYFVSFIHVMRKQTCTVT